MDKLLIILVTIKAAALAAAFVFFKLWRAEKNARLKVEGRIATLKHEHEDSLQREKRINEYLEKDNKQMREHLLLFQKNKQELLMEAVKNVANNPDKLNDSLRGVLSDPYGNKKRSSDK